MEHAGVFGTPEFCFGLRYRRRSVSGTPVGVAEDRTSGPRWRFAPLRPLLRNSAVGRISSPSLGLAGLAPLDRAKTPPARIRLPGRMASPVPYRAALRAGA